MRLARIGMVVALLGGAGRAWAGPPYLTDDPVPTDTGHWEIYAFTAGEGRGAALDQDLGLDLNYGPVKGVQLTATLPYSFSHAPLEGWTSGTGDVELGAKWRFLDQEGFGLAAAVFPRVILPTAAGSGGERVRVLLPLWLEHDFAGGTALFGGGGFTLNPGAGNRHYAQAAAALTHDFLPALSLGAELAWQGADTEGGTAQTRAGVGAVFRIAEHVALLGSGGPTWKEHRASYRFYLALGLFF